MENQDELFDVTKHLRTAPCVIGLREAVRKWKTDNYRGATDTTKELLNYWFYTDHKIADGSRFRYYPAQQEAIETLIFVYEIEKLRTRKALLEKYAFNTKDLRLPPYDDFARYCIKMATGSGKTKVMALAVVWQYFNAVKEDPVQYAKNFLVFAPNVIVFERLKSDFANGRIFRADPLIPKHYSLFWDLEFYMRGDEERAGSDGGFYLTNIQQFYERSNGNSEEPEEITDILGPKPQFSKVELTDFGERLAKRDGNLLVINDEAHHTHDEESEWNKIIRKMNKDRTAIVSQLDFSATPRYSKGALFAWTISDYPLKQAIIDGIVKKPIKGISRINEATSNIASVKYEGFLTAGVKRWEEYKISFEKLNRKKPVLFIMMNSTKEADDIADYIRTKYPEHFGSGKTLVIHTDNTGDVSKKDLDEARKAARMIDDESSEINAIVSVLMLREGWDVQSVTVVVGLRPYTAKANILPEQTIGRGLRLMFRNNSQMGYNERVDIIGNKAFLKFIDELEKIEDIVFDTFEIGKEKLNIITIMPDKMKISNDIGIPELTPLLNRKKTIAEEIKNIDIMNFKTIPFKESDSEIKSFKYEGYDLVSKLKILEREYTIPPVRSAEEVIGYYSKRIAENMKIPSQFSVIAPKVREYFKKRAFEQEVNLNDKKVILAMSTKVATYIVTNEFEKELKNIVIEEATPALSTPKKYLSETNPFPYSRTVIESNKTIFNYVTCENGFEKAFAKFLDSCPDVKSFSKLPEQFGFSIEYTDTRANIRHYYPDWVIIDGNGKNWIIETKGRVDIDVIKKNEAAYRWCENATILTGENWSYMIVTQKDFETLNPDSLEELMILPS